MVRGRRSLEKESFWRAHVERQAAGGGAIRQYCRDHGLSEPSFYTWRRELRIRDGECLTTNGDPKTELVAVNVVDSADQWANFIAHCSLLTAHCSLLTAEPSRGQNRPVLAM